jgi:NADP-dependent 3-hydroxy acid dehydrogenase YdfG
MTQPAPVKPLDELRGKVAIVTGASSGIGQAIAEQLLQHGTHVALAARRIERLESTIERSRGDGCGEALAVRCDVREPEDVQALVQQTLDRWGKLDILVANAGLGYRKPFLDSDIEHWRRMIDTNVWGLLLTLKYGIKPMADQRSGHVIVMSSNAARNSTPLASAYCGTKAGATAIADSVRQEFGPLGIQVTAVEPGVVISEFQEVATYTPDIVENMLKGAEPLMPVDVARVVIQVVQQPPNVGIAEVLVRPRGQMYP